MSRLPATWKEQPLGALCLPVETVNPSRLGVRRINYIDISAIDTATKQITPRDILSKEAPSRARQLVRKGDVLVSTVRPELNAVAKVRGGLDGAIASTGFCVLRPDPSLLDSDYLFSWAKTDDFINRLAQLQRGISYPSVRDSDVKSVKINLPTLSEQREIVTLLMETGGLREDYQAIRTKALVILPQLFEEMFLIEEKPDLWPVITVEEAGEVQLGRQRSPKYQTGRYSKPYLRVANVLEDKIDVSDVLEMDFNSTDLVKYRLEYGDILLNEGQSTDLVGRPAMWRDELPECYFQNTLIRFRPDPLKTNSEYALSLFLKYYRDGTFSKISAKTSSIAHLGSARFASLAYPLPPPELQNAFAERAEGVRAVLRQLEDRQRVFERVNALLTPIAFSGDLTARWRESHADALEAEAQRRDEALGLAPASIEEILGDVVIITAEDLQSTAKRQEASITIQQAIDIAAARSIKFEGVFTATNATSLLRDTALRVYEQVISKDKDRVQEILRNASHAQQVVDDLLEQQRQQALEVLERLKSAILLPLSNTPQTSETAKIKEITEGLSTLATILVLSPNNPAHPRATFWREVHAKSPVREIYHALRVSNGYGTQDTILELFEELGDEQITLPEIRQAIDVLAAAGLILPVTLDMPDPVSPQTTFVFLEAYRLPQSGDDARSDFDHSSTESTS